MAMFTATRLQIVTYLFGICPFSIAFLVFLNSSVSFVVYDLIGQSEGVGDVVGNLGFADELVALIACPFWGLLSDRIGVRSVSALGYAIICLALIVFVQAKNVYPQLLLGRLFFSIGGAAASTMVTAVLPSMTFIDKVSQSSQQMPTPARNGHASMPSVASELTITPARFQSSASSNSHTAQSSKVVDVATSTSRIAGFVGMFTGVGALLALFVFLPLPAMFQKKGLPPGRALQHSYYIVAAVALVLAVLCTIGLRNLESDKKKGFHFFGKRESSDTPRDTLHKPAIHTITLLQQAFVAGFRRSDIAIGYLGGFVARASSVGISLFIPLLVNALFTTSGLCAIGGFANDPAGLPDIKRRCPRAYIVASELTGVSQLVALLSAPLFGYWSGRTSRKTIPIAVASLCGVVGYPLFAAQFSPDDNNHRARAWSFVAVCLIGLSQIGAIVCSLASLSSGVLADSVESSSTRIQPSLTPSHPSEDTTEDQPLLGKSKQPLALAEAKGSVAGVYSFFGGAAILILTKAGGALFDSVSTAAPFYIMAVFNVILLVASVCTVAFSGFSSTSS